MDLSQITLLLLTFVVVCCAVLQTYRPNFLSKQTSDALTSMTVGLLGILFSSWVLLVFLRSRNREGFETKDSSTRWKELSQTYKLDEICSLYTDLYEKILVVEKGPPGDAKTDAQAREATEKRFESPALSCSTVNNLSNASTPQALFQALQTTPDTLFVQAYRTLASCRSLLQEQYDQVMKNQERKVEDFQDVPICSPEVAAQRRVAKANQTQCVLPEEVDPARLEQSIQIKLSRMETVFSTQIPSNAESISKILKDAQRLKQEMEAKKQEALATSNKYNLKA
jgi:hypothetical protein